MALVLRLAVTAAALWLATALYPQALQVDDPRTLLLAALLLGLVNAVVRPVVLLLTLPLNLLTLGLFTLVVNTLMLYLVAWLLHIPHGGFGSLFVLALWVSLAGLALAKLVAL
ncbi:MAG: phage holin family protein [Armatimonadota bacterium]|nr:phage holin family protein [Armatimonadota bacterium]MDW8156336.1 phage holin family protein [Armatimonadota bacterium]